MYGRCIRHLWRPAASTSTNALANPPTWCAEAVAQVMPFREPYNFRIQDIEDQVLNGCLGWEGGADAYVQT